MGVILDGINEAVEGQFDNEPGGGFVDGTVETFNRGLGVSERIFEDTTGIDYQWTGIEPTDVAPILAGPPGWAALAAEQQMPDNPILEVIDDAGSDGSPVLDNPDTEGDDDNAVCSGIETVTGLSCSEISLAVRVLIILVISGAGLWLLRPLFEIVAGLTGGDEV
ncbi:hypothetical protein [Halogeometricum borinquense]|uniref:hypothetical protein n=1 Tax=Halogeometricum borinquense TaxID=60847 RepID=UPI00341440B6